MQTFRLSATAVQNLGEAAEGVVGSWVLEVSGTFSGSLVLRKRIRASGQVSAATAAPTYYQNFATGVNVAANTAITAPGLFFIPCYGCDLILDYTHTSGVCVVEAEPVLG